VYNNFFSLSTLSLDLVNACKLHVGSMEEELSALTLPLRPKMSTILWSLQAQLIVLTDERGLDKS
jgi:hypothetical protein